MKPTTPHAPLSPRALDAKPGVETLPRQFEQFIRTADRAQHAFDALSARVVELKAELEETNQKLRDKVQELDRLNNHQLALLNNLSDAVVALDGRQIVRFLNPAAEKLLGAGATAWLGQSWSQCIDPSTRLGELLADAFRDGAASPRRRVTLRTPDGRRLPATGVVTPVRDGMGTLIGAVLVLQDLKEISDLQDQVRQTADLAEIGRMSSVVAHEIRNPLGGIEGFANLLVADLKTQPNPQRYAQKVIDGVKDLNRIVANMLTFAKPAELKGERVAMPALLRDLAELVQADASINRNRCRIGFRQHGAHDTLVADRGLLRQIFLNLLRNAVEALHQRADGRIEVSLHDDRLDGDAALRIDVLDNGPGIAPDVAATLFKPFVTTKNKGTGLGLATVHKMVELHGGQVRCVPGPAGGACFQVFLPLNPEHAHAEV